jgi:hypothetical protein
VPAATAPSMRVDGYLLLVAESDDVAAEPSS